MMHGVHSNLTAALLALHTVLGCCWHHAHCCTQACAAAASIAASGVGENDHAHHTTTPAGSHGQGHDGRHDCQGATCVFVTTSKADRHGLALRFEPSPAAPVPINSAIARDGIGVQPFYPPDALLPPLRRHLICRVLLI